MLVPSPGDQIYVSTFYLKSKGYCWWLLLALSWGNGLKSIELVNKLGPDKHGWPFTNDLFKCDQPLSEPIMSKFRVPHVYQPPWRDLYHSKLEQGTIASGNSVKRTGNEPLSESMATYLTDTFVRHQDVYRKLFLIQSRGGVQLGVGGVGVGWGGGGDTVTCLYSIILNNIMHTTHRWLRYNTKHKNNKGYSIPRPHGQAMMGSLLTVYCRNFTVL